jgi:hypothetical protein
MSVTLADIEGKAEKYAKARDEMRAIAAAMQEGIDAIKRSELPKLRKAVAKAAEHHDVLKAMIEASPELFQKPKTVILHGIRVGYSKGKGSIAWDDADAVVAAIQKHLPDMAEQLIRWTGRPLKEAINQLDVATLKKIGCRVTDTGEQIVIKAVDSEFDRLVDALLKDATEEARVA